MKTVMRLRVFTGKQSQKISLDETGKILLIDVKNKPEKNKANKEIIKMLKKKFEAEIKIVSGLKNKEKIVEIYSTKKEILAKLKP